MEFCHFVASVYPHMLTNFDQFIFICIKMALIFVGVLKVFTVSSFKKSDSLYFIANDEWSQFTQPQSYESGLEQCWKAATEAKTSSRVLNLKCTLVNLVCVAGESY